MFKPEQIEALSAPLSRLHVKQRKQAGRSLSYIEGWHAIAEANRIFGFDAWSRETVDLRVVSEHERTIGQDKRAGWGVTYVAKVRVTVGAIVREGCGTGHGIDVDLGQAHESALKEAETDAMKRALMTFGNPFGLALYDKEQAAVCDEKPAAKLPAPAKSTAATLDALLASMQFAKSVEDLKQWNKDNQPAIADLNDEDYRDMQEAYQALKVDLQRRMLAA